MSTAEWLEHFRATKVQSLVCGQSDHSPIVILPEGILVKPQCPWLFEQFWLEKEGCHDTVARSWVAVQSGSPLTAVMGKIDRCQEKLKKWSKDLVCNISRTLVEKKELSKAKIAALPGGGMWTFSAIEIRSNRASPYGRANVASAKPHPLVGLG